MEANEFDTRAQADESPDRQVRRWLLEIKLARKREQDWRKESEQIWARYEAADNLPNSFDILWANTDTLRPALYNSSPKPDVRRRFRQSDMLGKAVGEVMERGLHYCVDANDFDDTIKLDVLDGLLPGRAMSRVRYVPSFKQVGVTAETHEEEAEEGTHEAQEGNAEEVEFEQCTVEHVQWDDFCHGPGKTWDEVGWEAFRHRLTRDDLIEKFGEEIGREIKLNATEDDDLQKKENEDVAGVFKRAELWEIWDKEGQKVFFVNESYKKGPIYPKDQEDKGEPPLKLKGFFPNPRPLRLVENSRTLIPTPMYRLYKKQAEELDRLSDRITKIENACRVRFAYDPALTELNELLTKPDNEGVPVENARAWINNGGLDKAIWWMPIEQLVAVLKVLLEAREACKATIYELTGISDIVRGQTEASETATAQQIKSNYASLRLQRMQREVQRYVRDLIRIMAEVIGEHFSAETLAQMTGLNFPDQASKAQAQLQAQSLSAQQQPIPEDLQKLLMMPTWDEVMAVLRSDMQREFRVDVETDSTVAETLSSDMAGLREVLTGLVQFWQGSGPAVMSGALKIDAVKAISLQICRRARLGLEVEDAIETGMQQPQPQQQHQDNSAAVEATKQQGEAQRQQAEHAHIERLEQIKVTGENMRHSAEMDQEWRKAQLDAETKVIVATISAKQQANSDAVAAQNEQQRAQMEAADKAQDREMQAQERQQVEEKHGEMQATIAQALNEFRAAIQHLSTPRSRVVTTPDGRQYTSQEVMQ